MDGSKFDFLSGLKAGLVYYVGLIYWVVIAMNKYGGINIILSVFSMLLLALYLSLYLASFSYAISILKSRLEVPIFLSSPLVWTLLEYLRTYALSGFPWGLLAYSQYSFPYAIQICTITGPYFVSFLVVCLSNSFFIILRKDLYSRRCFFFILFAAFLFLSTFFYGKYMLGKDVGGRVEKSVALIQASIPQDIKWTEEHKISSILIHFRKTLDLRGKADLVVWPETAIPFILEKNPEIEKAVSDLARTLNLSILTGALSSDEDRNLYNAAFLFDNEGKLRGIYKKVHLVPFGEYTPLLKYFPFLSRISVSGQDFSPGKEHEPLFLPTFGKIGILICYEGIFPDIARETVKRGSSVLINLTNDAWYDRSSAPHQHFAFYIFRAIETGRYVIRCANTGISAIIDPRGRIIKKSSLFTDETILGKIFLGDDETYYVKYGNWFIVLVFFFFLFLVLARLFSHKNFWKQKGNFRHIGNNKKTEDKKE